LVKTETVRDTIEIIGDSWRYSGDAMEINRDTVEMQWRYSRDWRSLDD
jgi:hypothetical protein